MDDKGTILRNIISRVLKLCQALLEKVFFGRRGKIVSPVCLKIIKGGERPSIKKCKNGSDSAQKLFKLFNT